MDNEKIKRLGYALIARSSDNGMRKGGFLYVAGEQLVHLTAPTGDVALMALGELVSLMEIEADQETRHDIGATVGDLLQLLYGTSTQILLN